MTVYVDATTAQHARGIGTVIDGILHGLSPAAAADTVVTAGPGLAPVDGLEIHRIRMVRRRPGRLLYQRLLLPLHVARLARSHGRADRVLLLDAYVPMVRPERRVRYGALVHDVLPLTHPQYWPRSKRLVKQAAFRSLRAGQVSLFASTEYNAHLLEKHLGREARVVQFGCGQLRDEEADVALRSGLAERSTGLLYVGALEPRKDVLFLLDAFDHSERQLAHGLTLTIVGDGSEDYRAILERRIQISPFRERIRILSGLSRRTALDLIAGASALILPTRAEGLGLPILEALALGTPVVARSLAEIASWAGDSVLYADDALGSWSDAIGAAVETSESKRRAGQKAVRDFRWKRCCDELLDF